MKASVLAFAAGVACICAAPAQATLDRQALSLVVDTAEQICGTYERAGSRNSVSVEGEVNAELKGLARKLADLGVSGTAQIEDSDYVGVLVEELPEELKDIRACRERIFDKLYEDIDRSDVGGGTGGGSDGRRDGRVVQPVPARLDGFIVWSNYINCQIQNPQPYPVTVTAIHYVLNSQWGLQPVSYPCQINCGLLAYGSNVFSGPANNAGVMTATCAVDVLAQG